MVQRLGLLIMCVSVRAELGPAGELESRLFAPCFDAALDAELERHRS